MHCPKCRYISFDHLPRCPKCNYDWSGAKKALNLDWLVKPESVPDKNNPPLDYLHWKTGILTSNTSKADNQDSIDSWTSGRAVELVKNLSVFKKEASQEPPSQSEERPDNEKKAG